MDFGTFWVDRAGRKKHEWLPGPNFRPLDFLGLSGQATLLWRWPANFALRPHHWPNLSCGCQDSFFKGELRFEREQFNGVIKYIVWLLCTFSLHCVWIHACLRWSFDFGWKINSFSTNGEEVVHALQGLYITWLGTCEHYLEKKAFAIQTFSLKKTEKSYRLTKGQKNSEAQFLLVTGFLLNTVMWRQASTVVKTFDFTVKIYIRGREAFCSRLFIFY